MHTVHTVTTLGQQPIAVHIEVTTTSGIPEIVLIGLANKTIIEAKDRVVTALKHWGVKIKARKIIINLQPADLKKTGSYYDLALAVGLLNLLHNSQVPVKGAIFLGELSLNGQLQPLQEVISKVQAAKQLGYTTIFLPQQNASEAALVPNVTIKGITSIGQLLSSENNAKIPIVTQTLPTKYIEHDDSAFDRLQQQAHTKQALVIAVAGHHHLHLVGPPGVGKTTLAQAAAALLPPLTNTELVEIISLYEAANKSKTKIDAIRNPSSQATFSHMFGNSRQLSPGEASLSHHGILFLDEISQISSHILFELRKVLDEKKVVLHNSSCNAQYPANFLLLAASNPCPCGYWKTSIRACKCSSAQRAKYVKKLSGPLLDRIDMQLHISTTDCLTSSSPIVPITAVEARRKIILAKQRQTKRYHNTSLEKNSDLRLENYIKFCDLTVPADRLLTTAIVRYKLSYRSIEKVIAVAQTIADLSTSPTILPAHIKEALSYRFELHWSE